MPTPTALNLDFALGISGLYEATGDPYTLSTVQKIAVAYRSSLSIGTGANQADRLYVGSGTVNATGTALDLSGILIDKLGNILSLVEIVGIVVENLETIDGNDLIIGAATSNVWATMFGSDTDVIKVRASGVFCNFTPLATGFVVVAGTDDQLLLKAGGAYTVAYRICIIGRTA